MINTGDILYSTMNCFNEMLAVNFYLVVKRTPKTAVLQELECDQAIDPERDAHRLDLLCTPIMTAPRGEPFRSKIRTWKSDGEEYISAGYEFIKSWDGEPVEAWQEG
ncbi:MAG: hypothetical protein LBN30_07470 [Oscillospiraceae bacterium]|jgi:hypothetical protein|nr:hypothetical protein [Oscillospiraceae bacterium]